MKSRELVKQYDDIKTLIEQTTLSTDSNIELQGHWGKYICILVAGFLENAISDVYSEFVKKSASPQVIGYTIYSLEKIQNPKHNKFIEVASKFNKDWGKQFDNYLNDDSGRRKDAIDSIMRTRHQIAHGKNTSISVVKVKEHLERCVEVIEFIEKQTCRQIEIIKLAEK